MGKKFDVNDFKGVNTMERFNLNNSDVALRKQRVGVTADLLDGERIKS